MHRMCSGWGSGSTHGDAAYNRKTGRRRTNLARKRGEIINTSSDIGPNQGKLLNSL